MKLITYLLLLLMLSHWTLAQEGVIKNFSGTIEKEKIVAIVKIIDTIFSASYYYTSDENLHHMYGSIKDFQIVATERAGDSNRGFVSGKISNDFSMIKGTIQLSSKRKPSSFSWKQTQEKGSGDLKAINKEYDYVWRKNRNGDELGCKAYYSMCFVSHLPDSIAKTRINDELFDANIPTNASDQKTEEAMLSMIQDDFDSFREDFDTSYLDPDTARIGDSPYLFQWKKAQTCEVIFNENYLLSLQMIYTFKGEVQTYEGWSDLVFDLRTGETLQPENFFKPGYQNQLNQLALLQILAHYNAGSLQQLSTKGFSFENGFSVNNNFLIQKKGVIFTFNSDELSQTEPGIVQIMIPWSSLQAWIDPNGPGAWALRK